ncbi:MAG: M20/M25/M40 family metallo-hydrolase [Armatimonadetes bacterium]|nr:M20/M25/M40 family metallo-hydrolase [Anaerolineae bacterium]
MFDLKTHLKALVESHAPSGHEAPIRDLLRAEWRDLVDDFQQDKLGSLIGIKRATRPPGNGTARRIMLAAHMDEIGMMVRDIVDGFIYVHRISGVDNRVMPAQPVLVHGVRPLPGVVASVPPHLLTAEARRKYPTFNELIIDVGLPADEVAALVRIGDLITPDVPLLELQGRRVAAKALDDRACVAAVTVCLDALRGMQHTWDVYATATVQEETGIYGAKTAAYAIQPDIAIALDVTFGKQPGVEADASFELGGGPALGLGPNFHTKLNEHIRKTARYHEIKLQDEPISGHSGTDAWAIQVAQGGVPTALLGIPLRNMHSPVETVDLRDIERTGRLLAHVIASLEPDFLASIAYDHTKRAEVQVLSAE